MALDDGFEPSPTAFVPDPWWDREVAVGPPCAEHQASTGREIPLLVASRRG